MKANFKLLLLTLVTLSSNINAAWFESKGQAQIINDNVEIARNYAVQDALRQAMLYGGAKVSSIQEISNGLLTSDRFEVRSQGAVRDIQLLNERHKNGYLSVTIRADIVRDPDQCRASQFNKTLVLTQFPLAKRSQATDGAIFDLGKLTAQQLHHKINAIEGKLEITEIFPVQQPWLNSQQAATTAAVTQIANSSNAQYVLTAQISDISMAQISNNWLDLMTESRTRQFALNVFLYDGINGEQIWNKQYQTTAPWHYERQAQVDVSSANFWQSAYGMAINAQLDQLYNDLNQRLSCEVVAGTIIKAVDQSYTINLGSQHGLNTGDILKVIHRGHFIDPHGISRQTLRLSDARLKIVQIGRYHLEAQPLDTSLAGGVQIRDKVVKE